MDNASETTGKIVAFIVACVAVVPWIYLMAGGGAAKTHRVDNAIALTKGGDPAHGHDVIVQSGCASCHSIPGVAGPRGQIGPPLDQVKDRAMIAGVLVNSPENMMQWLQDPPAVDPKTAMPNLGLSKQDARDVTAYLYVLPPP